MFEEAAKAIDCVEEEKNKLVKALSDMDKEKLTLYDLKTYAEILEILSKIKIETYFDKLTNLFGSSSVGFGGSQIKTIGDYKGGTENAM